MQYVFIERSVRRNHFPGQERHMHKATVQWHREVHRFVEEPGPSQAVPASFGKSEIIRLSHTQFGGFVCYPLLKNLDLVPIPSQEKSSETTGNTTTVDQYFELFHLLPLPWKNPRAKPCPIN